MTKVICHMQFLMCNSFIILIYTIYYSAYIEYEFNWILLQLKKKSIFFK